MNYIKEHDILVGDMNEELISMYYKDKYNINLIKLPQNHEMDFIDSNRKMYIEVKSRNCKHDKYPTTMVGVNKFIYASKCNKDVYFVFAFNDGNYYYKYNNNDIFDIDVGGRKDRGLNEYKDYVYIPIEMLTKMD